MQLCFQLKVYHKIEDIAIEIYTFFEKTKEVFFMTEFRDILRVQGVKAKGFGIIPKMVMLDRKLTIEAKAIYAYFCSYAGAGDTVFPTRDKICEDLGIGKTRFYKHFQLLLDFGYIEVEQIRDERGKFKHNIYTLTDKPVPKIVDNSTDNIVDKGSDKKDVPCPQNDDTDKNKVNSAFHPCPQNRDTDNRDTDNEDTNNNNLLYNQQSFIKETVSQSKSMTDKTELFHQIKEQAQINLYLYEEDRKLLENAIYRLLHSNNTFKLNGRIITDKEIEEKLLQLNLEMCDLALGKFDLAVKNNPDIKNKLQYFCVLLYNAIDEYYAER